MPKDFRLVCNTRRVILGNNCSTIVVLNDIVHNRAPRFSCVYRNIACNVTHLGTARRVPIVCKLLAAGSLRRTGSHDNNGLNGGNSRYTVSTVGVTGFWLRGGTLSIKLGLASETFVVSLLCVWSCVLCVIYVVEPLFM